MWLSKKPVIKCRNRPSVKEQWQENQSVKSHLTKVVKTQRWIGVCLTVSAAEGVCNRWPQNTLMSMLDWQWYTTPVALAALRKVKGLISWNWISLWSLERKDFNLLIIVELLDLETFWHLQWHSHFNATFQKPKILKLDEYGVYQHMSVHFSD